MSAHRTMMALAGCAAAVAVELCGAAHAAGPPSDEDGGLPDAIGEIRELDRVITRAHETHAIGILIGTMHCMGAAVLDPRIVVGLRIAWRRRTAKRSLPMSRSSQTRKSPSRERRSTERSGRSDRRTSRACKARVRPPTIGRSSSWPKNPAASFPCESEATRPASLASSPGAYVADAAGRRSLGPDLFGHRHSLERDPA